MYDTYPDSTKASTHPEPPPSRRHQPREQEIPTLWNTQTSTSSPFAFFSLMNLAVRLLHLASTTLPFLSHSDAGKDSSDLSTPTRETPPHTQALCSGMPWALSILPAPSRSRTRYGSSKSTSWVRGTITGRLRLGRVGKQFCRFLKASRGRSGHQHLGSYKDY